MLSDAVEKKAEEIPTPRRGLTCFNCSGDHSLRDCKERRDFTRIAESRKAMGPKLGYDSFSMFMKIIDKLTK